MYTSRQLGRTAGPPAHEPAFLYAPLSATPTGTSGAITPNNPWARFNQAAPMAVTAQKKAITNHAKGSSGSPSEAPNEWSLASAGYGPMGGGIIKTKRLLTLAFDDKEAVWSLPETFAEVEEIARNWIQPPEGARFDFRIPSEYASLLASRLVHGPYLSIVNEETYQIAIDRMQVIRIEIVSDAPPPPEEEPSPPPPPPPVFEMPCEFDLELFPGHRVALGTICTSEDLDMSRDEDGTLVDGSFWGCLKITHTDEQHAMEFRGTRVSPSPSTTSTSLSLPLPTDLVMDHRTVERLAVASRPSTVKSSIRIFSPKEDNIEIGIYFSPMWTLTSSFPPAEKEGEQKCKWHVKTKPGGVIEHLGTSVVMSELFYEATPDTSVMSLSGFVTRSNSYAMPLASFMVHLTKVLDSFGIPMTARSSFISNNFPAFSLHRNIAFRFMPPKSINRAIELWCTHTVPITWTRIFLMWRGVSDDELGSTFIPAGMGEKEANEKDWKSVIEYKEEASDTALFSVSEISAIECA
ncbi:hypothetical protein FRC04_000922 [Tulasnella sp. 424]|nr:hypothetical protein FRC04_000922 [Tulasnella sp. 424]